MYYEYTKGYYFIESAEDKRKLKKFKDRGHCFHKNSSIDKLHTMCFGGDEDFDDVDIEEILNRRYSTVLKNGAEISLRYVLDEDFEFKGSAEVCILCTVNYQGKEFNIVYSDECDIFDYSLRSYISDISEIMKVFRYDEWDDNFPCGYYLDFYGPRYFIISPNEFNVYKALNDYKKSYREKRNQVTKKEFLKLIQEMEEEIAC